MDRPDDLDELEAFRTQVREMLAGRLMPHDADNKQRFFGIGDADEDIEAGRTALKELSEGGWSVPSWPKEYGGAGLTPLQAMVFAEEQGHFHVPGSYAFGVGLGLVGPTIIRYGNDEQKARWLDAIRTGREIWCQLFSEPEAGSDLAGLRTRAERTSDGKWLLNGQKTWSSRAHYADWGLLLTRSDPTVGKHSGITAFCISMRTPGVDVRPLRQINGDAHFNEVFLEDVVVDDEQRLGEIGKGWDVAMTTLANERAGVGSHGAPLGGPQAVIDMVRASGRGDDPIIRQRAAEIIIEMEVSSYTAQRARAAILRGGVPGPEGSGGKLRYTKIVRLFAQLALDLEGPAGLLNDGDAQLLFLTSPSISIRGGTDEIQRNIISERVLHLPPDLRVDKGVPFSAIRTSGRSARPSDSA